MSELSTPGGFWFRTRDPLLPLDRLRKAVLGLTRARRLQILVDHGFAGLFLGLVLAAAAMLAARAEAFPVSPWPLAGAIVVAAIAVAVLVGWWKRPAALQVAIRADLQLKLKQRLSTAWEYMTVNGDGALTERLAVQAANAGLPADPGAVFPLRLNGWGRLAPLAALTLLLAAVVDIEREQAPPPRASDERVVSEGERLGVFGRAMQERAARAQLPRSARQGAELERLGTRMESSSLTRGQAVGELRRMDASLEEERRQALAEAGAGDDATPGRERGSAGRAGVDPEAMLDRMRRGGLDSADMGALTRYRQELARSGGTADALDKALARHRDGADDALRAILENLARTERARKEDRELARAREQVLRAQESLGASAPRARNQGTLPEIDWDGDEHADRDARGTEDDRAETRRSSQAGRADPRFASRGDGVGTERAQSPYRPEPGPRGPVLQPKGEMREGESHSSHARLPARAGKSSVENVEMAREFAPQVEEVLSREQYPAHYKEFIRRYFLSLSRGARGAPDPSAPEGGKQ